MAQIGGAFHLPSCIADSCPRVAARPVASVAASPESVERPIARAARLVHADRVSDAVPIVSAALTGAPPGNGGCLLAVEPLLRVGHDHDAWAPALTVVHLRAR